MHTHSGYKVAGTRIRAILDGFIDGFPKLALWLTIFLRLHWWCPGRLTPAVASTAGILATDRGTRTSLRLGESRCDAESTLPSRLWHGAPIGILEEVEAAGVFLPIDEQPRNPSVFPHVSLRMVIFFFCGG